MIQVKTFYAYNDLRNYSYLLQDDLTGESWVIDPYEAGPIIDYIKKNQLQLLGILNTHQHFDHVRGNGPLREAFGADARRLLNGEAVQLSQEHSLRSLDTPGHTLDHQVFILSEGLHQKALFSGDTLFNAGVGNCKNGGDVDLLYRTTMALKGLPSSMVLYPGHDYLKRNLEFAHSLEPENKFIRSFMSEVKNEDAEFRAPRTLEDELKVNPFLRLHSEEIQETVLKEKNTLEHESDFERDLFKKIRSIRDRW